MRDLLRIIGAAGARLRMRVARRDRARVRVGARAGAASASCSRPTSPRARNTPGRSSRASRSRSTISTCCEQWPQLFNGREVLVRVDTGTGRGHHQHVRTAGGTCQIRRAARRTCRAGVRWPPRPVAASSACMRTPAAASSRSATGPRRPKLLLDGSTIFPDLRILNVGGGLGVPERTRAGRARSGAARCVAGCGARRTPGLELWLEPGRYLVAAAGVLLARVTQTKSQGTTRYVGVATGMNSLIRPALYGAWHEIVNLTRLDEAATRSWSMSSARSANRPMCSATTDCCRQRAKATCC